MYLILFNAPGTDVTSEHTMPALIIANIIFITGILVFAVLLGMVGEEVCAVGPPHHLTVFALVLGMVGKEGGGLLCCLAWLGAVGPPFEAPGMTSPSSFLATRKVWACM